MTIANDCDYYVTMRGLRARISAIESAQVHPSALEPERRRIAATERDCSNYHLRRLREGFNLATGLPVGSTL